MARETSFEIIEEVPSEDSEMNELRNKLEEKEKKLNELNRHLEKKVIDRTIEIRKLLNHNIRFIDNLSHDLATPITPLISLLPIIKEDIKSEKTKEIVDTCIRNVEYMKRVVDNTRKLADISSTDLMLKKENLHDIVEEIIKKYDIVFKNSNIKIENNVSDDIIVKTEKSRLLEVFDQILSNSVYNINDNGSITINAKKVEKEKNDFIKVSIKDTGKGLSREQLNNIFDEFYKTDESRHKLDSTGLGLTICKRIIEKHGGKIWADSRGENQGVSIIFTIPSKEVIYDRSF